MFSGTRIGVMVGEDATNPPLPRAGVSGSVESIDGVGGAGGSTGGGKEEGGEGDGEISTSCGGEPKIY